MAMVRHPAIQIDANTEVLGARGKTFSQPFAIPDVNKDVLLRITTKSDMVDAARNQHSKFPRHAGSIFESEILINSYFQG